MKRIAVLLSIPLIGILGCSREPAVSPWRETLTQVSSCGALDRAEFGGLIAVSNLLEFGDTGWGVVADQDGELAVRSNRAYRIAWDGSAAPADPSARVAFANVTGFDTDLMFDLADVALPVLVRTMQWKLPCKDCAYAIVIHGLFAKLDVRSLKAAGDRFPTRDAAILAGQKITGLTDVEATLVGFLTPDNGGRWLPEGMILYALTADGTVGGAVVDFQMRAGRVEADETRDIRILQPRTLTAQ